MPQNRRTWMQRAALALAGTLLARTGAAAPVRAASAAPKLGAFSLSLSVRDLSASRAFYEALGFIPTGGSEAQNYLIMKNGNALIGLFRGMFEGNMITFNPGWDEGAKKLDSFDDVRAIQKGLKEKGYPLLTEAKEGTGPGYFTVKDPDGNTLLFDQHV